MSKLISKEVLLECFKNEITESSDTTDWLNMINRQPTAFDVEKVVEKLEYLLNDFGEHCEVYSKPNCNHVSCSDCVLRHGIEIVKGGEIDEM